MNVYAAPARGQKALPVPGPADLLPYGPGAVVVVIGAPGPNDPARWAAPLGMAAIRGADLVRSNS